ncbi:GIP [Symbiodinium natans]|uniref:GIP protein n=1 Tax=Symbiodinium natans TaxID=878477 RepID=A0A812KR24_9DINO|nr:GIP [Symbiodinium natans]
MGAIVEQLGYTLMWSAGSCKLLHPDGRKLKLRVRNGCPELVQSKALELISRLEERKLAEIEQLRRHTEEGRDRIRQARIALEKSWWEHLMDYARDGVSCSGDAAVANAPFFTDVPRCALRGLVPSGDAGDESLWDMLRSALPNLNRRRRKALQQSRHWIVHLFAGVTHPDVYCLSADVAGPIRVPAKDPEGRSKHPPVFRYFLAASYRFPKLQGTKDEPNPAQVDGFDDPLLHPGGEDELADVVVEGPPEPDHRPDGKDALPEEEHPWERAKCEFEAPPGLARLVFVVPLHTNKSEAVLEALQQVFLELRSLNLPVLRFHSDRSREFFNKRTRAWFHEHGVRTTTAEGDTPQQNGAAENTIRWLKARARTLLAQAEVGTELWACAMATAASQQRAQQLGLKSKLAAPFGAPCSVKLKFYGPSRGDLGDRWVDGKYMGLSPSVNDGHIVLRNDGVGNGFLQTLHVRSRLHSPEMPDRVFEGDVREPAPLEPARRVRGKSEPALGEPPLPPPPLPPPEGECVPAPASRTRLRGKSSPAVSKSLLFPLPDGECPPEQCEAVEEEFRASRFSVVDLEGFAKELLLEDWDLEEAMWVLVQFSRLQSLKAGLYRHGGVVGTTSATNSYPWLTELMAATLLSASPEAEFTSLWLSNTNPMSLHADHNNVEGSVNVVFPLKLPPEGGDLWVELRAGDVIYGSVEQRVDSAGKKWLGTTHSLQRGKPFYLDPKRRHATTPFEGERVVLVAYTVNTLGKVPESELQALESLGFPLPASARLPLTTQQDVRRLDVFDMFEQGPLELAGEDCPKKVEKGGGWKEAQKVEAGTVELEVSWNLKHTPMQHEQTPCVLQTLEPKPHAQVEEESWPEQPVQWELWLPDPQSGQQLRALRSDDLDLRLCKSEPVYTLDIEQLLSGLTEPLQIVHTVDPREAEKHSEVWIPSILKEIGVIEKAVHRLPPSEVRKGNWLHRTDVRVVPAKLVFTVKPPDVQTTAPGNGEHATQASLFKRKARLVACGNHAPSTGTEIYASGAAAESLRCLVVISSKRGWRLGILDVTSAFLLTPIPQGDGFPVFALTPPRYLVRQGLAHEGELWILTHAVYGLRESPKLWSDFRDSQLLNLRCMANGVELQLLRGKLDTNWWRVVQTSDGQVVGGLITYVDDFLLAGCAEVIEALAKAIQSIWKTTPLTLAYAEELLRLNNVKPTALGKIPCPRDLVSFDTLLTDEAPTEESVRTAQRLTGEILWLSQRTRPDLAFTACVLATLSTKAPERAARIAERALAYVQQTKAFALTADADDTGLVAYSDASFAPDGNRSHTGWVVFLYGSPVCWRSARQSFVTLSTAESELVAGLDAVVALQSAEAMLGEFGVFNLGKTLKVDSQSALAIAIGQGSWRTRHLKVRANYLREQYEAGEIIPVYCPGVEQAADLLTKALPAARILELATIWGLFEHCPEDPRQAEAVAADLPTHPQYPQIKLLFLLLAMVQIQSAKCQPELVDEEEGDVHQVELSTDLMFMLLVGFVGIGFIAVRELAKWCLRRHSLCRIHSTAKQRKLQRLRDRTAQAIEASVWRCRVPFHRKSSSSCRAD